MTSRCWRRPDRPARRETWGSLLSVSWISPRAITQGGRALLVSAVVLLVSAVLAPVVSARVTLVATGRPELAFIDVSTGAVVERLALPGPARAVDVTRDGRHGFIAAGSAVVQIDVNTHSETAGVTLDVPELADLALTPDQATLCVVGGDQLLVLDAATLATRAVISLRGIAGQLAISADGRRAAVALRGGRVAFVDLRAKRLLRLVRLADAVGVAFTADGRALVTARGRLRTIRPRQHKAQKRAIRLPAGAAGALALSPGGSRLAVGAVAGHATAAILDLRSGRIRRLASGKGPGVPAWDPYGSRIVLADAGGATVSLVSPRSRARLKTISLWGSAPADVVVQPGLALMSGTTGPDVLTGTRGPDRIEGLDGDDVLRGGRDRDVLDGGAGDDRLSGGAGSDRLIGGPGNDFALGANGDDKIDGGEGDDGIDAGTGNDTINGGDGNDTIDGGDGDDTISGGPGDDEIIEKGFGNDKLLSGGPGDDTIRGGRGNDYLTGDDGDDELYGETGSDRFSGGRGDDIVHGGAGSDVMLGDEGNDTMRGGPGNDTLRGGPGEDQLNGGSDTDILSGADGNDQIIGGPGPDTIDAGAGDDSIRVADDSTDSVDCGSGHDTVYVEDSAPTRDTLIDCELVIRVPAEAADDDVIRSVIRGTNGNDVLRGTSGPDSMFGRTGNDTLFGAGGEDYVDGEDGNDTLRGGPGDDILAGRNGATRSTATTATTASPATVATTGSSAAPATTRSTATSAMTSSTVALATTASTPSGAASTSSPAAPATTPSSRTTSTSSPGIAKPYADKRAADDPSRARRLHQLSWTFLQDRQSRLRGLRQPSLAHGVAIMSLPATRVSSWAWAGLSDWSTRRIGVPPSCGGAGVVNDNVSCGIHRALSRRRPVGQINAELRRAPAWSLRTRPSRGLGRRQPLQAGGKATCPERRGRDPFP